MVALKANTKLVNSAEAKAKKEMKYSEKEKYAKTYDTLTSEKDKIQDKMNNLILYYYLLMVVKTF